MTAQMTLDGEAKPASRSQAIRDLFVTLGGEMGLRQFAEELIANDIYSEDEVRAAGVRAIQSDARRALKVLDDVGLPYAGPTAVESENGTPIWQQRRFWPYDTYVLNFTERINNRNENHVIALRIHHECFIRYGQAPIIPELPETAAAS